MVEEVLGSLELRRSLPFGAVGAMAKTFGITPAWIGQVVAGKKIGDSSIIECAVKISALNEESQTKITEILKDYGDTYGAGK